MIKQNKFAGAPIKQFKETSEQKRRVTAKTGQIKQCLSEVLLWIITFES